MKRAPLGQCASRGTAPMFASLPALFQGSEKVFEGGRFLVFLLKKEFPVLECPPALIVYEKSLINRLRVLIARLILPRPAGVLLLKQPPEENPIPQSLLEYAKSVHGIDPQSRDTSSREGSHEQG